MRLRRHAQKLPGCEDGPLSVRLPQLEVDSPAVDPVEPCDRQCLVVPYEICRARNDASGSKNQDVLLVPPDHKPINGIRKIGFVRLLLTICRCGRQHCGAGAFKKLSSRDLIHDRKSSVDEWGRGGRSGLLQWTVSGLVIEGADHRKGAFAFHVCDFVEQECVWTTLEKFLLNLVVGLLLR